MSFMQMSIHSIHSSIFRPHQNLEEYIFKFIHSVSEGSIIVVTSKIVSLAEGRIVKNNPGQKRKWIRQESEQVYKTAWFYLTQKDGHWCPNAGIDESNANENLILWPTDSYGVAHDLCLRLMRRYHVKKLGILITDSRLFPLRAGVIGVALGYAGFKGLRDYRGKPDLFGRSLRMTQTNIADCLASTAVLCMGEGNERTPLAVIERAPVHFIKKVDASELRIDPRHDLYRPLFSRL